MSKFFIFFTLLIFLTVTCFGGMVTKETTKGMLSSNKITTISYSSNTFFAGTEEGLTVISYDTSIKSHDIGKVYSIYPVQNRTLIASETGVHLYSNGTLNQISRIPATCIKLIGNTIYLGTKGCHVSSFPVKNLFDKSIKLKTFSIPLRTADNEKRSNVYVSDIVSDAEGNLWFSTLGFGLIQKDSKGEYSYFPKNKTGSSWITSLALINGEIHAGSAKGLFKIVNDEIVNIPFPKNQISQVKQILTEGSKVYIASTSGVYRYIDNQLEIYSEDTIAPKNLTSIALFDDLLTCGTPYGIWIEEEKTLNSEILPEIQPVKTSEKPSESQFEDQFVVCFKSETTQEQIEELNKEFNCEILKQNPLTNTYRLKIQSREPVESLVETYQKSQLVDYSEPEFILSISEGTEPNDPFYGDKQKNLKTIKYNQIFSTLPTDIEPVKVAVVDTGVQIKHEDLDDICLPGYNVIDNNTNVMDDQGHGTHCAGIIAAEINNGAGIAGVCKYAKIIPVKVMSSNGKGSSSDVAEGILWAVNNGAQMINLSLGSTVKVTSIERAVETAHKKGIAVFGAAGNNGKHETFYPGGFPQALCVGAVDNDRSLASFSNYGTHVDMVAPGVKIASTYFDKTNPNNNKHYVFSSGTSMACPHVTGAAALILALHPELKVEDLYSILLKASKVDEFTTTALGPCNVPLYNKSAVMSTQSLGDFLSNFMKFISGLLGGGKDPHITRQGDWDPKFGYGVLDLQKALQLAEEKVDFSDFNRLNLKQNRK